VNIFIDESGSFVNAPELDSWNSIAAYMSPESDRKRLRELVERLKRTVGVPTHTEVKLKNLSELQYFEFLERLGLLGGVLYAVATDAGLNQPADIAEHQRGQAENSVEHKDKMLHQSAREGLQDLSARVAALAPQLYVQLQCQVNLIANILLSGILYFVQRRPNSLGRFRWRIDQKNSTQTEYEKAFVSLTPAFLQTISLTEPMPMLIGADYSTFSRFDYSEENRPRYLKETYGLAMDEDKPVTNIGMLMQEDLEFVDSKHNQGVQVADLLASGIRRCLRQEFSNNELAARLLGRLIVQGYRGHPPIQFLNFSRSEKHATDAVARFSKIMEHNSRTILIR
jgi:hypothetical protein